GRPSTVYGPLRRLTGRSAGTPDGLAYSSVPSGLRTSSQRPATASSPSSSGSALQLIPPAGVRSSICSATSRSSRSPPSRSSERLCCRKANTPPAYRASTALRTAAYQSVRRTRMLRWRHQLSWLALAQDEPDAAHRVDGLRRYVLLDLTPA